MRCGAKNNAPFGHAMRWFLPAFLLAIFALTSPVRAQTSDTVFEQRARQLVDIMASRGSADDFFARSFLDVVPATKITEIANALTAQNGKVIGVAKLSTTGLFLGNVDISYERATVSFTLTLSPEPPNKVIGLLITNVQARDDSTAKLEADVRKLPGSASFLVMRVDGPRGPPLFSVEPDQRLAIGSAFKLWILAEAARSVNAKKRRWSDVVTLRARSLPSGIMQKWPRSSPVTLHSLATMMISLSDNTATDALLMALGRAQVDAILPVVGHTLPSSTLPILSTTEAFALKIARNADLRRSYEGASPTQRRRLLDANAARLTIDSSMLPEFVGRPIAVQTIEWFASPRDMANTLDWLRRNGGQTTLDILAINQGIPEGQAARFAYIGFKGGSEAGVITMNLLVQTRTGQWYTTTASWNNSNAAVDETQFFSLFLRAVALIP